MNKNKFTAMYDLYKVFIQYMNQGEKPVCIFCDLSRAFDCVDHTKLLEKLNCYEIESIFNNQIRTYHHQRTQYVEQKT